MTKEEFKLVLDKFSQYVHAEETVEPDADERKLWDMAFNDELEPISQYDAFMAGFFNSKFLGIPWSDNIRVDEFWNFRGKYCMNEGDFLVPSRVARGFRFTANGISGLMEGPIPSRKFNGWRFQLDVLRLDGALSATLYVQFKRPNEYFTLTMGNTVHGCRATLVGFLESAWMFGGALMPL